MTYSTADSQSFCKYSRVSQSLKVSVHFEIRNDLRCFSRHGRCALRLIMRTKTNYSFSLNQNLRHHIWFQKKVAVKKQGFQSPQIALPSSDSSQTTKAIPPLATGKKSRDDS